MIGKQLDLFGPPLLPPKKITEEEAHSSKQKEKNVIPDELVAPLPEEEAETTIHVQMPAPSVTDSEVDNGDEHLPETDDMPQTFEALSEDDQEDMKQEAERQMDAENAPHESTAEATPSLNIPADQMLYSRQYYTMRETAAMFNVNQSLLRFWENEFDILKPKKNRKGDRYFRPEDIKNLELIYHLLKVRRFTIGGAKEYMKNRSKTLDTFEMVQRLEKIKQFLLELKAHY